MSFDALNDVWKTTIPFDFDDHAFLTCMPRVVPCPGLPADVEPVTACGTFATDGRTLGVKSMDSDHDNPASNHDRAGAPENYKQFLIAGARGKGGKNYSGGYSGSAEIE
jgi:hypothetical protein